jgi:hypothetical protein
MASSALIRDTYTLTRITHSLLCLCYRVNNSRFKCQKQQGLFTKVSRTAVGPTQPPIQRVLGDLSHQEMGKRGVKQLVHKANQSLYLVPRLRMSGDIPLLLLDAFMTWRGAALPSFTNFYHLKSNSTLILH